MRTGIFALFMIAYVSARSQNDIPLGTWRTHFSYNQVLAVAEAGDRIYAVAENGLFYFDRADNSLGTISKINGLQEDNISNVAFDTSREQLIIGYASGNLDVLLNNEITSLDLTTNSQVLGSKQINDITISNNRAFISTDFGLMNFDLQKIEVTEIYRELGSNAEEIIVNASTVLGDSIYLATEVGVIASNINNNVNLFDPQNWRRYDINDGIELVNISKVETFDSKVIAAINQEGLLSYNSGRWTTLSVMEGQNFKSLSADEENLLVVSSDQIGRLNQSFALEIINDIVITNVNDGIISDRSIVLADESNGLLIETSGSFSSLKPTGPQSNEIFRFYSSSNELLGVPGGFDGSRQPLSNDQGYYMFSEGKWLDFSGVVESFKGFNDITDATILSANTYFSSFGSGVLQLNPDGSSEVFDETNSTLRKDTTNDESIYITGLASSQEGIWVLNYEVNQPLHLFFDNSWQSFSLLSNKLLDIVNSRRYLWMNVDPRAGGGLIVFDKSSQESRLLNDTDGNGGLPSDNVNALAVDNDGFVWVGTNEGVAFFSNSNDLLSGSIDAIIPIFENRLLLRDEIITSIEIDPGNRKWIGTENGLWLFDEDADRQLLNFNTDNSPLPSNLIKDLEVVGETGEIFIGTPDGIVSFRADATNATDSHGDVKIFPNPITNDFNGTVGISGLAFNVDVKITDASGKLIWNTKSAGGTATWDARDYNGRRAATGVYFVFSSSEDGEETFIGKIAVIN